MSESGGRTYWGLKDFTVHVFGVKQVIKTLVFQEQDKVTAACATTAIWSTLSKVYNDFQASYKSPSQITRDADSVSQDGSRLFPNKGLSVLQICQAIERSGLELSVLNAVKCKMLARVVAVVNKQTPYVKKSA